jgi:hypothetical protein
MSAEDLEARIEDAKNEHQRSKELLSEARSLSGQTGGEGLLDRAMGTIVTIFDDVVEPIATTIAGTVLGAWAGAPFGVIGMGIGANIGGINGAFTGKRNIYDWSSIEGRRAFFIDSTWGLLGTSLSNISNVYNSVIAPSSYQPDLSERQNRQVYDEGFYFEKNSAVTLGNVISNLEGRDPSTGSDLLDHESVHIQQNRSHGPLYPLSYASWSVGGAVAGLVAAPFTEQNWRDDVRDMAYVNNPWEREAYKYGGDPNGGELAFDNS